MNPPSVAEEPLGDLAPLRAEIDRIDDAIHDLLMQRAEVVGRVARSAGKAGSRVALRPGREAAMLRRLLARHRGALPAQAIVRLWRELLAATTGMQRQFVIAVCDPDPACAFTQAAREHFGALTPLRAGPDPAQVLADVAAGAASVAVLPMPFGPPPAQSGWWPALLRPELGLHVVARLPFWSPRPEGAPAVQALVVAPVAPDPSGEDCSLLAVAFPREPDAARLRRALAAADLGCEGLVLSADPPAALAEVPGFLAPDDPRLARLPPDLGRPALLGAYAIPVPAGGTP